MKTSKIFYGLFTAFFAIGMTLGGINLANAQVYPGTFPTTQTFGNTSVIGFGSTGPQVASLQQFLQSRGYLAMPAGVDYGYFGPLTQNALIRFQAQNILPQTGVLDSRTLSFMNTLGFGTNQFPTNPTFPTYPSSNGSFTCPPGFTLTTFNGIFGCFLFTNGNGFDNNDFFSNGRDADLNNFDLSKGDDTTIEEGDDENEIAQIEFDVDDGDFELDRVRIDFEFTGNSRGEDRPWEVFDEIRLLSNGDEIDSIDGSDEDEWDKIDDDTYEIEFNDLNEIIRENDNADLTIEVDVQNNVDGSNGDTKYKLTVPDDGIRGFDDDGSTEEIGDDGDSITITID